MRQSDEVVRKIFYSLQDHTRLIIYISTGEGGCHIDCSESCESFNNHKVCKKIDRPDPAYLDRISVLLENKTLTGSSPC